MPSDNEDLKAEAAAIRRRIKAAMRTYREACHLTQEGMAEKLGVTKKSYQKYEGEDIRGIPAEVIARFSTLSGIPLDYLLLGGNSGPRKSGKHKA
jgi:transcriptional regulator with XRE-family HTH domain